jgi:hypothetical protein
MNDCHFGYIAKSLKETLLLPSHHTIQNHFTYLPINRLTYLPTYLPTYYLFKPKLTDYQSIQVPTFLPTFVLFTAEP